MILMTMMKMVHANDTRHEKQRYKIMKTQVGAVGIIITTGVAISSSDSSSNSTSI